MRKKTYGNSWNVGDFVHSHLPQCSTFLSEEIEKSLRVFRLISTPVRDLGRGKKEKRAKKGVHRSNTL